MLKGIIMVAQGAPFYGRMAYNLAVTIKANENIPICVLHGGNGLSHLSEKQKGIFDHIIEIKSTAFGAKLTLCDYTPFGQTLYLDCDMAWMPGKLPSDIFKELETVTFTSITEGFYDLDNNKDEGNPMYHYWCSPQEAKLKYKLTGKFYQWRSEIMYFTKDAKKLFDLAKKIYASPKIGVKSFAGQLPDEMAINIAACSLGIEPHLYKWKPAYWHRLHGEGKSLPDIMYQYYLMSMGGNFASNTMKTCYNNICKAAHRKLGLQYLFLPDSKKSVLPERLKI
jgi:hypothetical protein